MSFELPTKLDQSFGYEFKVAQQHLQLPLHVECGLKFHLPALKPEGLDFLPDPKGYYAGAYLPLGYQTLDILHFATVDRNFNQLYRDQASAYALDTITTARLTSPITVTHPFHPNALNAQFQTQRGQGRGPTPSDPAQNEPAKPTSAPHSRRSQV